MMRIIRYKRDEKKWHSFQKRIDTGMQNEFKKLGIFYVVLSKATTLWCNCLDGVCVINTSNHSYLLPTWNY